MCSISGIIKKTGVAQSDINCVATMNDALIHRGPNSAGYFKAEQVALGMRRLSIIDLAGGQQPLFNEDGTVALIINGEIYNYVELRKELSEKGHTFSTQSDCETVIHAYEEYGKDFASHLRGQFAFCLFDQKKNVVLLVRDRMGEKPVYLYENDDSIAFSSEMKALVTMVPKAERVLDQSALYSYFFYQYIPEPQTALLHVRKLPPATILEINLADFSRKEWAYWSMTDAPEETGTPENVVRGVLDELEEIIIRADVPVGVSLSGGIDSSIIAILSARYKKNLHAFSIGYQNRPANDERALARSLAENLGMKFHEIEISQDEFVRDFDKLIFALDDPIADIAAYGYYRVAEAAKDAGVPVLLAGFGGDELFWGYNWATNSVKYNILKQKVLTRFTLFFRLLLKHKRDILARPFKTCAKIVRQSFGSGYLLYDLTPGFDFAVQHQSNFFTKSFLSAQNKSAPYSFFMNADVEHPELETPVLLEKLWMLANCIPLGDRLSMAHSVEMRLPLLDYLLVQKTIALRKQTPGDYLLPLKQWLVGAMGKDLPSEIKARKKLGFTPPTTLWIREVVKKNAERIANGYLVKNAILEKSFVEHALSKPTEYQNFLYKALVLETWIMQYLY